MENLSLSRNFNLSELLKSPTADRWGFKEQYEPPMHVVDNLRNLCIHVLQPIRDFLEKPIRVTSGYRCPRVNAKVGGASKKVDGKVIQTSQHVRGEAADIEIWINGVESNGEIVRAVKHLLQNKNFTFDQCILEYGTLNNPSWIHLSYSKERNRKQVLRKETGKGYIEIKL